MRNQDKPGKLDGLTVLTGHICCRCCYRHISEVMGKLNITCCIHINSYGDFFL